MIFDKKSARTPKNVSCVLWDLILHWQYKIHIQYMFRNNFCPPKIYLTIKEFILYQQHISGKLRLNRLYRKKDY